VSASKVSNIMSASDARRSTRIFKSVPLSVSGYNRLGSTFMETTSAVAVNCHGCLYPSRHEYKPGSWVTLEVPSDSGTGKVRPVRAQVRFIRLPGNPHELYQVGVELETPANVWGIQTPPEDWMRYPGALSAASGALRAAAASAENGAASNGSAENGSFAASDAEAQSSSWSSVATAEPPPSETHVSDLPNGEPAEHVPSAPVAFASQRKPARVVVPADQLVKALEGKLEQAAERAIAGALNSHVNTALDQVAKAVEVFTQASLHQIEEGCAQHTEKVVSAAFQEIRARLQGDIAQADGHLRRQVEVFLGLAQETAQRLEKSAEAVKPLLAEAQDFMSEASNELQQRFGSRLREMADRASGEFESEASRCADRQTARLNEKAQTITGEASTRLEARADGARSQVETAASTALAEFHVTALVEIEQFVSDARKGVESSLASLVNETRTAWEARQRTYQEELTRTTEREIGRFRETLESVGTASMVAAMSAVQEHSKAVLETLGKKNTK
jgi:hypothetical protein